MRPVACRDSSGPVELDQGALQSLVTVLVEKIVNSVPERFEDVLEHTDRNVVPSAVLAPGELGRGNRSPVRAADDHYIELELAVVDQLLEPTRDPGGGPAPARACYSRTRFRSPRA